MLAWPFGLGLEPFFVHTISRYLKRNGNRVSPAHSKVRSYSPKKLLQGNTVGDFLTPVVEFFLKYVFITYVSECFQTSVRVKSSPVLFKSNLKGLALQVFGKRAGIVVNFLSLYILKIAAFLQMNCFVTPSRGGSHGAHTWSTVINAAKAQCAFKSVSPAATGTSAPLSWGFSHFSWPWPGRGNSSLVPSKGLLGLLVKRGQQGFQAWVVFLVFLGGLCVFIFIDHQRMALWHLKNLFSTCECMVLNTTLE